jgi:hypothetical protein
MSQFVATTGPCSHAQDMLEFLILRCPSSKLKTSRQPISMEPDDSARTWMARFHAYYIPWAWKLAIVACVYILKVLLSPFRRVEVHDAFQLARAALVARAWPQEVYEME